MKLALEVSLAYLVFAFAYVVGQLTSSSAGRHLSPFMAAGILVAPPFLFLILTQLVAEFEVMRKETRKRDAAHRRKEARKKKAAAEAAHREETKDQDERFRQYAKTFGCEYPGGLK